MNQGLLFFPVLAIILLIASVLIIMFRRRTSAVARGDLTSAYYKTYDTVQVIPREVRQAERCFVNLLETTPIFFAICLFAVSLGKVDLIFLVMAWFYVACRLLQSIVHITSNKLGPRSQLYMLGWLIMLAFSFRLGWMII